MRVTGRRRSLSESLSEEKAIQSTDEPDRPHHLLGGEQRTGDVWTRARARVMPDAQPLVGHAEHRLERDHVSGQAQRMDPCTRDVGAAGLTGAVDLVEGHVQGWLSSPPNSSASSRTVPLGASILVLCA